MKNIKFGMMFMKSLHTTFKQILSPFSYTCALELK